MKNAKPKHNTYIADDHKVRNNIPPHGGHRVSAKRAHQPEHTGHQYRAHHHLGEDFVAHSIPRFRWELAIEECVPPVAKEAEIDTGGGHVSYRKQNKVSKL